MPSTLPEGWERWEPVGSSDAIEATAMYAGESVCFVRSEESAEDIVRAIAEGAENLLNAMH